MGLTFILEWIPNSVDEDFIPFYDLKILAGRTFIKDDNPDGVIISRFAARRLGFNSPEEAVGAKINRRGWEERILERRCCDRRIREFPQPIFPQYE